MQLRHVRTVRPSQGGIARIHAVACSPNNKRVAVADNTRYIQLFDEFGELRDRFPLKSSDGKTPMTFIVRGMAFSADSSRLAVAQSDFIVFVYKVGVEWGDRKSICNKFPQPTPVTCLTWPNPAIIGPDAIVFGTQEGKVKVALLRTNKAPTLISSDRAVVAVASCPDGSAIVSGHEDGTIMKFTFDGDGEVTGVAAKVAVHPCIPYALAWGETMVASGSDCRVLFYDRAGHVMQSFDYPVAEDRDVSIAAFNPSGHALVIGCWNKARVFNFSLRARRWEEGVVLPLANSLALTALTWRDDGSRLVCGTLCGAVDLFDAWIRRYRLMGAFEFTYVSHNQVIVKRIANSSRIVLRSSVGGEIAKVNVHKDRFLIGHTATTILIGDLETCRLSEVPWQLNGREQFFFDNPQVCMIYLAGELCLVEYGRNEVLGTCRTDSVNMHRMSVRIHDSTDHSAAAAEGGAVASSTSGAVRKAIAYLIDRQTIQIDNLVSGMAIARIAHTFKIDWLELNHRATKMLFRDKQHQLFLFDVLTQTKTTLLNYCTYVQWVPDSDVVVAQNRNDLCVWYSIDNPDRVAVVHIKGEVQGIERNPGKTEVIVDEGPSTVAYALDEQLIEFGTAMEEKDYDKACDLLDLITLAPETEAMWSNLAQVALGEMRLYIAERCYAALGNVAKAHALRRINTLAAECQKESGGPAGSGYDHFLVRAELCILSDEFKRAEHLYVENGKVEKAMEMWEELLRFDEAIAVAESRGHPEAANKRAQYYDWLMSTKQEEKAGELKEKDGKYVDAINLYLRGGVPSRAAYVVSTYSVKPEPQLLEAIASALFKAQIFEKAGDLFERLKMDERAIDAYKKGHVFRRAVDLARRAFPTAVVGLEDSWGDYLVSQRQVDQAINHYIEAHQYSKAIESAISSRQWSKAVNILETQNVGGPADAMVQRYFKQIGAHFEEASQLSEAEKYYVKGNAITEAVDMYSRRGLTDHMFRIAQRHLSPPEITKLFLLQASQLEAKGDFAGAERLFIKVNEPDQAILMYKRARDFTNMLRLVKACRPEFEAKTNLTLGAQFEREGNLKMAEQYYIAGKDWNKACNMYRDHNMWDDVVRIAKVNGGAQAAKNVVLSRAMSVDPEEGVRLLAKFSLVEAGIEAALEATKFDIALQWAQLAMPARLPTVFLKNAMYWEDQGEFRMAEDAFIKAGKPREAIDMYCHQHDFASAMRVAEGYDVGAIATVCTAHGRWSFQQGNFKEAEALILRANVPELLLKLYVDARMLPDAQRIAKEYCPDKLATVAKQVAYSTTDPFQSGQLLEENGDYGAAIEQFLRCDKTNTTDPQQIVNACQRAVRVATQHVRAAVRETVKTAVGKLEELSRFDEAAKLYEETEDYKGAVMVYIKGTKFDQAEALAARISPDLVDLVKRARVQHAINANTSTARDELDSIDKDAALKAHIASGDWEKAMRLARQLGQDQTRCYAAMYVQFLMREQNVAKALEVIARDGIETADFRFFKTFVQLGQLVVLSLPSDLLDVGQLHDGLFAIVNNMQKMGQAPEDIERAQGVLNVIHIYATAQALRRAELPDLAAKLYLGLPRYVHVIPADKAYFDAGIAARDAGYPSIAFQYLNRLLDILDKIEDKEAIADLDNSDFASTDFPFSFPLPEQPCIAKKVLEELRQWVLTKSLEPSFDMALPQTTDARTGEEMFIAALATSSGQRFEGCSVTGFPVMPISRAKCTNCNRTSNVDDWNKFVVAFKSCPWCKAQQSVAFKV